MGRVALLVVVAAAAAASIVIWLQLSGVRAAVAEAQHTIRELRGWIDATQELYGRLDFVFKRVDYTWSAVLDLRDEVKQLERQVERLSARVSELNRTVAAAAEVVGGNATRKLEALLAENLRLREALRSRPAVGNVALEASVKREDDPLRGRACYVYVNATNVSNRTLAWVHVHIVYWYLDREKYVHDEEWDEAWELAPGETFEAEFLVPCDARFAVLAVDSEGGASMAHG